MRICVRPKKHPHRCASADRTDQLLAHGCGALSDGARSAPAVAGHREHREHQNPGGNTLGSSCACVLLAGPKMRHKF